MDARSGDSPRTATPSGTRRRALRLLASAGLGGILASLRGEPGTARAVGSRAGAGGNHRHGQRRQRRRRPHHHAGDKDKDKNTNRDRGGTKGKKGSSSSCPDCICPPDTRFAAVEACRARPGGVAVPGECDCAWLSEDPRDFPCRDTCLCWLTVQGTGFCGTFDPPLPDEGSQRCSADVPCPPITLGGQVFDQACVVWPDGDGPFCWPACEPREP